MTKLEPGYLTQLLTHKQMKILELRLANHSWRQIGLALNITEATARGHHQRALDRIRKDLNP